MNLDQLPPHDLEAEAAVLGCLLMDHANTVADARMLLPEAGDMFYDLKHRTIYDALVSLPDGQGDALTLAAKLNQVGKLESVGGRRFVSQLTECTATTANLEYYAAIVREKHVARRTLQVMAEATQRLMEGKDDQMQVIDRLELALARIREKADPDNQVLSPQQCAEKLKDYLEWRFELQGKRSGFETGLARFDQLTDGLQRGEQTIIAARPSVGKTAIALNIVEKVCLQQTVPTLFVSLEMSAGALTRRLLSGSRGIPMSTLKRGSFTNDQFKSFTGFMVQLKHSKLYIVDAVSGMDVAQVHNLVRYMHRKHGIQFVVLDYLQKVKPSVRHEKRTYEVAETSGMLKGLAVDTNAAFLTLAQLNREPEKDKKRPPRMTDLADSGQIERDADTVCLLHREEEKANLIVAKQRDGETGLVPLYFDAEHCRFENPRGNDHD